MTLLGTAMQIGASALLTFIPAAVLKKDQLRVSVALSFFAILAISHVGGLLLAIPTAGFLLLFSLWIRYVGHAKDGSKLTLFKITVILCALFIVLQVIHFPIRIFLEQPFAKLIVNVAGIFFAAALLSMPLELTRKRPQKEIASEANPLVV